MLQSRKVQYSPFKQDTLSFSKHIYLMLFTKNKQKKHFPCLRNSQAGNGVIFRNSKHFKHIHTHTQEKRCISDKKDQNSWSSEGTLCFLLTKPWSVHGKGMNGTDSVSTMNRTLTRTCTEAPSNKPGTWAHSVLNGNHPPWATDTGPRPSAPACLPALRPHRKRTSLYLGALTNF